jgi:hypothetical protein
LGKPSEERKPQTRLSQDSAHRGLEAAAAADGAHWNRVRWWLGAPVRRGPRHDEGALFPLLTGLERGPAGAEDSCYESAMPLLDGGVDGEEETAVHEQDPGMQEVRDWLLPALSLPTNSGAATACAARSWQACTWDWPSPGTGFGDQRRQSELGRAA